MLASLQGAAMLSAWFEPPFAIVGWVLGIIGAAVLAAVAGNKISGGST